MTPTLREFLAESGCLLVEPSASFAASLQSCLSEIGIPLSQISTSKKLDDAKRIIEEKRPRLIVTEYDLQPGLGLELIDLLEATYEDGQRISIIVTKNSSDSAVAEAAEGAVDAFILKPFSTEIFRAKVNEILMRKTQPSEYQRLLQQGRQKIVAKEFESALEILQQAKSKDERPSMAHCFAGQAFDRLNEPEKALAEYRAGRSLQPLHYKCLIGEFEILSRLKRYGEAYEIVDRIRDNYPIPPARLGEIFTAAVFTFHFDDLPKYFEMYLAMEGRTPWLTNLMATGFMTAGRYYLKNQRVDRATEFFEMGLSVRGREVSFLESIFDELLKIEAYKEADHFLQKALPSDMGGKTHSQMRFRMDQQTLSPEQLVEKGRRLINDGFGSPEIYRIMVKMLSALGRETLAESMIAHAVKDDPELRAPLYALLEKHRR